MVKSLTDHVVPINCCVPGCANVAGFVNKSTYTPGLKLTCHACVQVLSMASMDILGTHEESGDLACARPASNYLFRLEEVEKMFDNLLKKNERANRVTKKSEAEQEADDLAKEFMELMKAVK